MEGALAERLKREYNVVIDEDVALASLIYNEVDARVLKKLFVEYISGKLIYLKK